MTADATPVDTASAPRPAAARCHVLVVDDDLDIRDTLQEILEHEGYQVATARNGLEGLACAKLLRPELILLDLFMPVMDGAEFRRRQLSDPDIAAIPVVVVSAAVNLEERVRALGVAGLIEKPLHLDGLFHLVGRFCG